MGEVKTRPGSIVAPREPAPLGMRSHCLTRVNSSLFGAFAKASHILQHSESDGVVYTSGRLIKPTIAGKPFAFPLLIHAEVDEFRPVPAKEAEPE